MTTIRLFLVLAILSGASVRTRADIKIGAFNIQIFGRRKASLPDVMAVLVKVIRRYDILLIQEIRDSSGLAIIQLLDAVNKNQPPEKVFSMTISERLGRSSSKEQYAFFYRGAGLKFQGQYVYNDTMDRFEREPMIAGFSYNNFEFALVGIHIDPDKVPAELNALDAVIQSVRSERNVNNVMLLGDLNADCGYMPKYKWKDILLRTNTADYSWLIGDGIDTTIKNTHCAYDRFIASGPGWRSNIVAGSVKVYRFDQDFGLTQTQASKVSDHFPIEFTLRVGSRVETLTGVYIYLTDPSESLNKDQLYTVTKSQNRLQMEVFDGAVNVGSIRNKAANLYLFELYRKSGVSMVARPVTNRYRGRQKVDILVKLPV